MFRFTEHPVRTLSPRTLQRSSLLHVACFRRKRFGGRAVFKTCGTVVGFPRVRGIVRVRVETDEAFRKGSQRREKNSRVTSIKHLGDSDFQRPFLDIPFARQLTSFSPNYSAPRCLVDDGRVRTTDERGTSTGSGWQAWTRASSCDSCHGAGTGHAASLRLSCNLPVQLWQSPRTTKYPLLNRQNKAVATKLLG